MRKIVSSVLSLATLSCFTFFSTASWGELPESTAKIVELSHRYRIHSNIRYLKADNYELKLDLYERKTKGPNPTVIFFHGGGWQVGEKETQPKHFWFYLDLGFSVVNVEYRLAETSLAPAAVEDGLCALRWTIQKASRYHLDPNRIVVTGQSAGGHLALTTGMIPASAGLDSRCPGKEPLKVAAIINWFGPTDVNDLLRGDNVQDYAIAWMGSQINRDEIARRVSPINYVRSQLPPILTIHGERDALVPYSQAIRLHRKLDRAGVPNQLLSFPNREHGGFSFAEELQIYETIYEFLGKHQLLD